MSSEKIKLSDFVAHFLKEHGVEHVFGLTGGAVVHLFDSLDAVEGIEPIFTHHEQAAALAATAYAKCRGLGAGVFTTGPGCMNAMTGVLAAWQDSIPCLFISGNARLEHTSHNTPYRQIGTQEFDIVSFVKGITKYSVMLTNADDIGAELDKAYQIAVSGRPGPVWIDIPVNLQWEMVSPYVANKQEHPQPVHDSFDAVALDKVVAMLKSANRPLILAGYGVRLSQGEAALLQLINDFGIPTIASWTGSDMLPDDNENYIGIPGVSGQRGGNLAVQNCDLLIAIGSHLNLPITGTNIDNFAPGAKIVVVDIDPVELTPHTVRIDLPVQADAKAFCETLYGQLADGILPDISQWRDYCARYRSLNTVNQERIDRTDYADANYFIAQLTARLIHETIVVDGGGTALYAGFQASKTKTGQRLICASAISAMGTGLPDAIGACFATGEPVYCIIGDGSLQLNVQELQTITTYKLPIKIVVVNNDGYLAIRHTQDGFLGKRYVGSGASGNLTMPSIGKLAAAYNIDYICCLNNMDMGQAIETLLSADGPYVCELVVSPEDKTLFSQSFKQLDNGRFAACSLDDMEPLLPREQYDSLMYKNNQS